MFFTGFILLSVLLLFRLDMAVVGHENMVDEYGPANVTKICAE